MLLFFLKITIGPIAQLAEQQTLNLWVQGSIPCRFMPNTLALIATRVFFISHFSTSESAHHAFSAHVHIAPFLLAHNKPFPLTYLVNTAG